MALTTRAIVKARLGIASTDTSQDALIDTLVEEADSAVKEHIGLNIEQGTYTEYYKGNGTRALVLRERPVQSITSIHVDNDGYFGFGSSPFATADLLTAGTDYALDYVSSGEYSKSGIVYRVGTVWPSVSVDVGLLSPQQAKALGNIKVVYVAGFATVPKVYQEMATKYTCWKFKTDGSAGLLSSESISDTSYSYSLGALEGKSQAEVLSAICGSFREWTV